MGQGNVDEFGDEMEIIGKDEHGEFITMVKNYESPDDEIADLVGRISAAAERSRLANGFVI